jgi:hypothetical protein
VVGEAAVVGEKKPMKFFDYLKGGGIFAVRNILHGKAQHIYNHH